MKEGGGNDHLAIAWEYPGQSRVVIPAKFSRLEPKVKVIQQPAMLGNRKTFDGFWILLYYLLTCIIVLSRPCSQPCV